MRRKLYFITGILLCYSVGVFGQSYYNLNGDTIISRVYISAGFYYPNITTSLRVDSKSGIGTEINLEDDLKLEEELGVFKISGTIQASKKSQFLIGFTTVRRNRTFSIEEDITFKDTTFYVGASAKLNFDVDYYSLTWRYALYNKNNWLAGFSLGARGVNIKAGIDASLNNSSYSREASVIAPAMLLGFHLAGYIKPNLLFRYSLQYLYLNISGIDINVLETEASVHYYFYKNVGLGAAYSTNNYRIREIPLNDNFKGKVIFGFDGFNIFLTARLGNKVRN